MSDLETDLKMASISEVKVEDLNKKIDEAQEVLNQQTVDTETYNGIKNTLDKINELEDYEITPEIVQEVDTTINEAAKIVVERNGDFSIDISGTEQFGLSLTPKEWRKSRVAGCESILDELMKTIKRWNTQLKEKLEEIFLGNKYTIESLNERFGELDKKLIFITTLKDEKELITIPSVINQTLIMPDNRGALTTQPGFPNILDKEVKYIAMGIKSWVDESVRYKNSIIRYFGNKAKADFNILKRFHPKFFTKKDLVQDNLLWKTQYPFLGRATLCFVEPNGNYAPSDLNSFIELLNETGYDFYYEESNKFNDMKIYPFSIDELEKIKISIKSVISIMELLNSKPNDFDADTKDIKDVGETLKSNGDEGLIDNFLNLVSHYQENTIFIQSSFIRYLGQLASHLITFMFIHMEAYNESK